MYILNELGKNLTSTRSNSVSGPSSLSVVAETKHEICKAKKTNGVHKISGSETYATTSVAYY